MLSLSSCRRGLGIFSSESHWVDAGRAFGAHYMSKSEK